MSGVDAIDVGVEGLDAPGTGNVLPPPRVIRPALRRLLSTGEPTTIDLSSIPLAPHDRDQLLETLGEDEVEARVHAFGPTTIRETAYPGVWLVRHMNPHNEALSALIEIARLPAFLMTSEADAEDSAVALAARLAA